jgi:hypothetical protein
VEGSENGVLRSASSPLPYFILVLGQTLWRQIYEYGRPGPTIQIDAQERGARFFPTGCGAEALATFGIRRLRSTDGNVTRGLRWAWSKLG